MIGFGSGKAKCLCQHAKIKLYQKRMREEKRCGQCINPWHDGLCSCDKWGNEQNEIAHLGNRLLQEGWR